MGKGCISAVDALNGEGVHKCSGLSKWEGVHKCGGRTKWGGGAQVRWAH
jgi:hypothetical protein